MEDVKIGGDQDGVKILFVNTGVYNEEEEESSERNS